MSITTREQIMTALFNLIAATTWVQGTTTSATFAFSSRRLQLWNTVDKSNRPAFFLVDHSENVARQAPEIPMSNRIIECEIFIYIDASDQSSVPATTLNNILDAIDLALKPNQVTGYQTLGNLVSHCWIEGKVLKDPGDLDNDGLMVIPIKISIP